MVRGGIVWPILVMSAPHTVVVTIHWTTDWLNTSLWYTGTAMSKFLSYLHIYTCIMRSSKPHVYIDAGGFMKRWLVCSKMFCILSDL